MFVFSGILVVQFVNLPDELLGMFPFRTEALVLTLGYAAERGHTDTEKLIQIIRIDAQKAQPLQQRDLRLGSFQQNPAIEVHPTQITVYVCFLCNFLTIHPISIIYRQK